MNLIRSQCVLSAEDAADMRREDFWRRVRENRQRNCEHSQEDGVCIHCGAVVKEATK